MRYQAGLIGQPSVEGDAVCAELRFGDRQLHCRFAADAILKHEPAVGGRENLLEGFERHRERLRGLAVRKAATVQGGLLPEITITEWDTDVER